MLPLAHKKECCVTDQRAAAVSVAQNRCIVLLLLSGQELENSVNDFEQWLGNYSVPESEVR